MMSGNTQAVIRVFYCYAPADMYLLLGLEKQLSPLKRINAIAEWSDREVLAGTHRDQVVRSYLSYSDLILLLISPDFLSVDFCYSVEMQQALARHARGEAVIIPIILRPVMWGITEIRYLQALPKNKKPVTNWSNRDAAFYDVAVGITEVVKKLVEKHHKRFIEEYIANAKSEALINSSSWIPTDPFRAEKRADAEELYKNIYDKLKSVQMEIIQQGLILQQSTDPMVQDETDPEEEESSIHAMEQAFAQEPGLVGQEYDSSSERRAQQARDLVYTSSDQAMQPLTESEPSLPGLGADDEVVIEAEQPAITIVKQASTSPAGLTAREVEVLRLVAQGLTDAQVAEQLVISQRSVNSHLTTIYSKLQISSRSAATRYAIEHHLV